MKFYLILLWMFIGTKSLAGGDVGNGGDTVYCDYSTDNELGGYYSLDFLLTYRSGDQYRKGLNVSDYLSQIEALLVKNESPLLSSFQTFQSLLLNESDYSKPYIWLPNSFGLESVHDEHIVNHLPHNCFSPNTNKLRVVQTVVRLVRPGGVRFQYDKLVVEDLRRFKPMQLSYIYVHEWLWGHVSKPEAIYLANNFLHLISTDALSQKEFNISLMNLLK